MMETDKLESLGLGKSEAKVYLTLLEIGSSTTGPIMDKAKVSSSKIYGILQRLSERGLVSYITKEKIKYFRAASPETLLCLVEEETEKLKLKEKAIRQMIPMLDSIQKRPNKHHAQLYSGWKGIMSAYTQILDDMEEGSDYLAFAQTVNEEESKEVKIFFTQYQKKRKEKKLQVKLLAEQSEKGVFTKEPYITFKNFQVKFIECSPPGIVISKETILISTFHPSPVGVIISSREIAESFKKFFYHEWKKV